MGDFAQIKLSNTTMYAFLKNVTMYVLILRRFRNKLLIKTIHSKSEEKKDLCFRLYHECTKRNSWSMFQSNDELLGIQPEWSKKFSDHQKGT